MVEKKECEEKKVQVGYSRLNKIQEAVCQAGIIVDNVGIQTEIEETSIDLIRITKEETTPVFDELVDEEVQYDNDSDQYRTTKKENKGKKLQVGNSRLEIDFEVSCQTGHIIVDNECQTERSLINEELVETQFLENENSENITIGKEYCDYIDVSSKIFVEKEIQSDKLLNVKSVQNKTAQVGYPCINKTIAESCQITVNVENVDTQTEIEEITEILIQAEKEEDFIFIENMIDEEIQYGDENFCNSSNPKELLEKNLQTGNPRMKDSDISCQTGQMVKNEDCQTDEEVNDEYRLEVDFVQTMESSSIFVNKEFIEKEIQSDKCLNIKSGQNKMVQVGYSCVNEAIAESCQVTVNVENVDTQTEIDEITEILIQAEKEEDFNFIENMIDEEIQYGNENFCNSSNPKELLEKNLQTGNSRMKESDMSCQTGQMVKDEDCQTELKNKLKIDFVQREESTFEFVNKKIVEEKVESVEYLNTNDLSNSYDFNKDSSDIYFNKLQLDQDSQYDITLMTNIVSTQTENVKTMALINEACQYDVKDCVTSKISDSMSIPEQFDWQIDVADCKIKKFDEIKEKCLKSTDESVQTDEYIQSHSVSLQITPKSFNCDTNANLVLHYFNKQVEKKQSNKIKYEAFDIQKDSKKILQDRQAYYMNVPGKYKNKLTSFENVTDHRHFGNQFNCKIELNDKLVSYLPRINTFDHIFEFNGDFQNVLTDIDQIPPFITPDCVRLFESISVQVNDNEMTENHNEMINIIKTRDISETNPVLKYTSISTICDSENNFNKEIMFEETKETKVERIMKSVKTNTNNMKMINMEIMHENLMKENLSTSVEHDSNLTENIECINDVTQFYQLGKVEMNEKLLSVEINTDRVDMINVETMAEDEFDTIYERQLMTKVPVVEKGTNTSGKNNVEVVYKDVPKQSLTISVGYDSLCNDEENQIIEMEKEQSLFTLNNENVETNKDLDSPLQEKCEWMNKLNKCIIFENKMTSTPEMVEKCTFGTQMYSVPTYDGETQTSFSTKSYGIQVSDPAPMSIKPCFSPEIEDAHKSLENSILLFNDDKSKSYTNQCLDIFFEEDYVFETKRTRSLVTTKQEILPKFSYDFADNKEESSNLLPIKAALCNSKTQSISESSSDVAIQTDGKDYIKDYQFMSLYQRMLDSRCVKEQGVQGSSVEGLFEIIVKTKGLQFILQKYQKISNSIAVESQTEGVLVNSVKTQFQPYNVNSVSLQTNMFESMKYTSQVFGSEQDTMMSIMSSSGNRPAHRNMRVQRGCSYFDMINAGTNTDDIYADRIEVTYTETILEESVVTKRPKSRMDTCSEDNDVYSRTSSLNRRSSNSTPVPVSGYCNKHIQTSVGPSSQIFVQKDKCDQFLTFTKIVKINEVLDYRTSKYVSLTEAIEANLVNLDQDLFNLSESSKTSIESAMKERLIR